MFLCWVFGKNPDKSKVISASYSKALSIISSRTIRNKIQQEKSEPLQITYNDIFPDTVISSDNAAVEQWSIKDAFFSYKATSPGSSITGMGANLMVIDDLVADSFVANSEMELDKIYSWFFDTFASREEQNATTIIIGTKWSSKDHISRLLKSKEAKDFYVIEMKAFDEEKEEMLCEELLDKKQWDYLKRNMADDIFLANYQAEVIDKKGALYQNFNYYETLPEFEEIISYTDTADTGTDYLCSLVFGVKNQEGYLLDVVYTQEAMELTEKMVASLFHRNKVNQAKIESNSGGRGFARNVERILLDSFKSRYTNITTFTQKKNKFSRILTASSFVEKHLYFPEDIKHRFPKFYEDIKKYQRNNKANKHDDAVDTLTGIAEMLMTKERKGNKQKLNKYDLGL